MSDMLWYEATDGFDCSIVKDKIVHFTKKDNEITLIHLITGEIIETGNSIKTLTARMEAK